MVTVPPGSGSGSGSGSGPGTTSPPVPWGVGAEVNVKSAELSSESAPSVRSIEPGVGLVPGYSAGPEPSKVFVGP
jgi:hypothetical protein